MMKGGTSQDLFSFYLHNSWIYVEIMTQNVNFPIGLVQYLACQNTQRMHKVTLIVNKAHMVYRQNAFVGGGTRLFLNIKPLGSKLLIQK